jgi:uncharacterized membrane protein
MHVIVSNISWMGFNVLLALVAVLFGWLMKGAKSKLLQIIFGVAWIIFLPNTLYLFTDIIHFFRNIHHTVGIYKFLLIFQYLLLLLLGVITYFAAMYPAEKVFVQRMKWNKTTFIIIINGLIAFGMALGRVERISSWYILTNIPRVIHASAHVLTSTKLIILILLVTVMSTLLYFSLRVIAINIVHRLHIMQGIS